MIPAEQLLRAAVRSASLNRAFDLRIALTCPARGPFTRAAGRCEIAIWAGFPGPSDQGAPGHCKGYAREQDKSHETPSKEVGTQQEADEPDRVAQGRRLVRQGA